MLIEYPLIVTGALTGLMVGLTGVGGGALMTPILLLFFDITPTTAIGTDLWFAAFTKIVASRIHHKYGLIDWSIVKTLWLGSITASTLTLVWISFHPINTQTIHSLKLFISVAVIITATSMIFQKSFHALGYKLRTTDGPHFKIWQLPLTTIAGFILGTLVTLTSVGSGALGVVLLAYLYPLRLTTSRLIATDIVHAIPLTIFAGTGYLIMNEVDFQLLGNLLIGSIPAVIIGAILSTQLPHTLLRNLLSIVLITIGIKLWNT